MQDIRDRLLRSVVYNDPSRQRGGCNNYSAAGVTLVVGHDDGNVYGLEVTEGITTVLWQTHVAAKPISCLAHNELQVFGTLGKTSSSYLSSSCPREWDVVAAVGSELVFLSHDGTLKGRFDTYLGERIKKLHWAGSSIVVVCDTVCNFFETNIDKGCYVCNDRIIDACVISLGTVQYTLLACRDATLRLLKGTNVVSEFPLPSCPTVLAVLSKEFHGKVLVLCATSNGEVICFDLVPTGLSRLWQMRTGKHFSKPPRITSMQCWPLTFCPSSHPGRILLDIVIGFDDGRIDVYSFDSTFMNMSTPPTAWSLPHLICQANVKEPVTQISCRLGQALLSGPASDRMRSLSSGGFAFRGIPELYVTTFSGRVMVLVYCLDPPLVNVDEVLKQQILTDTPHPLQRQSASMSTEAALAVVSAASADGLKAHLKRELEALEELEKKSEAGRDWRDF